MRPRFSWTRVVAILALLAGAFAYAMLPGSSTFTVSTETTYVTGPLDKYGYVDYVTALNERLSKGITPENNANVLIWQALGPRPEDDTTMPPEYFQWLGIKSPPERASILSVGRIIWRSTRKTGSNQMRTTTECAGQPNGPGRPGRSRSLPSG